MALFLEKSKNSNEDIFKGITTSIELKSTFNFLIDKYDKIYAETDMRALYNPTRMKLIEKAIEKLLVKVNTLCPMCKMPGYSIVDAKPGLLCDNCGNPTRSTLLHVLECQSCKFTEEKLHPHGRKSEDPMYCDVCNP